MESALTAELRLIYEDENGEWQAQEVAGVGDADDVPLPVDISLSADDRYLWVDTFMDGTARLFDVSDPFHPKQIYQKRIGSQLNMVSQSWDGERLYFTSSPLSNWDKKGEANQQFLKAHTWNGEKLTPEFAIAFWAEELGRPHIMRFGGCSLYDGANNGGSRETPLSRRRAASGVCHQAPRRAVCWQPSRESVCS